MWKHMCFIASDNRAERPSLPGSDHLGSQRTGLCAIPDSDLRRTRSSEPSMNVKLRRRYLRDRIVTVVESRSLGHGH
jgi:hypothetical protein